MAGDLHRIQQRYRRNELEAARAVAEAADASSFVEEAFSEYHLYSLGRRTSVRNNETKQISLLTGTGVPVEKRFVVDGQQFYYRNQQHPGSPLKDPVKVYFRFKNDEDSGLGMPLPAGTVRVYQADANGSGLASELRAQGDFLSVAACEVRPEARKPVTHVHGP